MSARSRVRLREALRAPVETTDPAALTAYAKHLRPVVATLRTFVEDATAARPVYSKEHARHEMLKALPVDDPAYKGMFQMASQADRHVVVWQHTIQGQMLLYTLLVQGQVSEKDMSDMALSTMLGSYP